MQFTLAQKDVVNSTLVLDIGPNNGNMRGHFYLNGVDLGRMWGVAQGGATVQQYVLPLLIFELFSGLNLMAAADTTTCQSTSCARI